MIVVKLRWDGGDQKNQSLIEAETQQKIPQELWTELWLQLHAGVGELSKHE